MNSARKTNNENYFTEKRFYGRNTLNDRNVFLNEKNNSNKDLTTQPNFNSNNIKTNKVKTKKELKSNTKKEVDLNDNNIIKLLIRLSIPIILANILQTLFQLADTFWVGKLGKQEVAAISISFPIIFLLISLGIGLTTAGTILVAQFKGKIDKTESKREHKRNQVRNTNQKNEQKSKENKEQTKTQESNEQINKISSQMISLTIIFGLIITILGLFLTPFLINLMNTEEKVTDFAIQYLKISFLGIIPIFGFSAFQALLRGIGNVKTPMYVILIAVIFNFILDPLFIFGFGFIPSLSVSGAAIATVISQGLAFIVGVYSLFLGKHKIKIHFRDLKPDLTIFKKIFFLGFPVSIEQSVRALALTFMTYIVARFETSIIASFGIASRITSFAIIPAIGFSIATSTLVGYSLGGRKIKRAEEISEKSILLSFYFLYFLGIILFIFAEPITRVFIPNDPDVILEGARLIRILCLTFGFLGIQQIIDGILIGSGRTYLAMFLSILSLWIIRLPLAFILSMYTPLSYTGIWLSFPITDMIAFVLAFIIYKRGKWKTNVVADDFELKELNSIV